MQYTPPADRGNDAIAGLYSPLHPAFVRLLRPGDTVWDVGAASPDDIKLLGSGLDDETNRNLIGNRLGEMGKMSPFLTGESRQLFDAALRGRDLQTAMKVAEGWQKAQAETQQAIDQQRLLGPGRIAEDVAKQAALAPGNLQAERDKLGIRAEQDQRVAEAKVQESADAMFAEDQRRQPVNRQFRSHDDAVVRARQIAGHTMNEAPYPDRYDAEKKYERARTRLLDLYNLKNEVGLPLDFKKLNTNDPRRIMYEEAERDFNDANHGRAAEQSSMMGGNTPAPSAVSTRPASGRANRVPGAGLGPGTTANPHEDPYGGNDQAGGLSPEELDTLKRAIARKKAQLPNAQTDEIWAALERDGLGPLIDKYQRGQ